MEIKKVTISMTSYPRYVYTADSAIRMYKRFNFLLKTSELNIQEIPKYKDPDIYIISSQSGGQVLKESDLRVRAGKERKEASFETLQSLNEVNKQEEINPTSEKVVVVISKGITESIDFVKEFAMNTVIVYTSEEEKTFVMEKYSFIQKSSIAVVEHREVAKAIEAVLERIVFRRLFKLLEDLSQMKEIFKGPLIEDKFRERIEISVKGILGRDSKTFIRSISEEFRKQESIRGEISELRSMNEDFSEQGSISEEKSEQGTEPSIPEQFSGDEDKEKVYFTLQRLSKVFSNPIEQEIHGSYKKLPSKIKELFPMSLDVGAISDPLEPVILSFLVAYFPKDDDLEDLDVDVMSKTLNKNKNTLKKDLLTLSTKIPFLLEVDKRLRKIKEIYESSFHRLAWEIKAMYNRSKVPKDERPASENESKRLSPKVAKRLFDGVDVAVGTGYRCDKLHVYVRENSDMDKEKVRSDIKKVLGEFHITDFEMITSKETRHFKRVGARIRVARKGTLGGFAWMHDKSYSGKVDGEAQRKQLCALLSKHVVNGANEVYWIPSEQDEPIQIGSIIQAYDPNAGQPETPAVDVAAARILADQQQTCERQFKNSRREPSRCQLYDFADPDYLKGQRVHIFGASTRLGTGTITELEHFPRTAEEGLQYVVIEDMEPIEDDGGVIERFCQQGDSGAVICADTPDDEYVYVISMLIGSINYNEVERNPDLRGKYIGFRMTDGLRKLEEETSNLFSLCSD